MHTGKSYKILEFLFWTRRNIFWLLLMGIIPTVLYQVFELNGYPFPGLLLRCWVQPPAFIVGFQEFTNL